MATKIYCDRCNKVTRLALRGVHDDDHLVRLKASEGDTSTFDLCNGCYHLVMSFIQYPKDGNWKVMVK